MKPAARNRGAFTLVELVLAVGLTAVLAALLLSVVTNTLGIWQRGATTLQTESAGGLVLDRLVADLEGWTKVAGQEAWRESADAGTAELRVISHVASSAPGGTDPASVRLLIYTWNESTFRLYRWESTAVESLENGYSLTGGAAATEAEWLLGQGVLSLKVRWFDAAGTELSNEADGERPRSAQLELVMVDDGGRARLEAVATGRSSESVQQIQAETTRTMTRWVELTPGGGG